MKVAIVLAEDVPVVVCSTRETAKLWVKARQDKARRKRKPCPFYEIEEFTFWEGSHEWE
jgi:hypothetical protein